MRENSHALAWYASTPIFGRRNRTLAPLVGQSSLEALSPPRQKKTPDWGQLRFHVEREVFARCAKIRTPSPSECRALRGAPRSSGGETELSPRYAGQSSLSGTKKAGRLPCFFYGGEREIRIFQPMKKRIKTSAIKCRQILAQSGLLGFLVKLRQIES